MNRNLLDYQSIETVKNGMEVSWKVWNAPRLFTIGYEGKSIAAFVDSLSNNRISALIDVRYNPISRKPGFSKKAFRSHLENRGICYYHIPQLGVPSQYRRNLGTEESYRALFEYYDREILPANLLFIEKIKELISQYQRLAITCFEADYHICHRHRITQYMSQDTTFDIEVVHLQ